MQALPDLAVGLMNWLGRSTASASNGTPSLSTLISKTRWPLVLIENGHEGWKQGWQGTPVPLQPGFHLKFKPHEVVYRIDKRETTMHLPAVSAYTLDNVSVECMGSLRYQVADGQKALFGIQDVQKWVRDLALGAITIAVGSRNYSEISSAPARTHVFDVEQINNYAVPKGIRCIDLAVHRIQPSRDEMAMEIKQRILAESEAKLLATDSWVKASTKEINGIVKQMDTLAQAIASNPEKVEKKDRRAALTFLLEFRRTELLRELSSKGGGEREWTKELVKFKSYKDFKEEMARWKDTGKDKEEKHREKVKEQGGDLTN